TPCRCSTLNVGMPAAQVTPSSPHIDCRPNAVLNTCRSCAMVSLPYESTIAIVWPRPVSPPSYSGCRLYEARIACGVKQRRPTEKHCASVGGVVDVPTWVNSATVGCTATDATSAAWGSGPSADSTRVVLVADPSSHFFMRLLRGCAE